jgi:citrate lyase subunit beta / citryl-CoA lyase
MSPSAPSALQLARSFLFVPATRPERYAKALASGADVVIIDLEDAVAPADKEMARQSLADAWAGFAAAQRDRVLVRLNAPGTAWHEGDLEWLRKLAPAGVMVPKAESAASLALIAGACGAACAVIPLIETVAGLDAADASAPTRSNSRRGAWPWCWLPGGPTWRRRWTA